MTSILVIGQSYGRGYAATSDLFTDLAEGLAEQGWAVEVLTSAADGAPGSIVKCENVVIHRVSRRGSKQISRIPVLGRWISLASLWLGLVSWCLCTRRRYSHVIVLDTPHLVTLAALILKARLSPAVIAWVMDRPLLQIQRLNPAGSLKSWLGGWLNAWQARLYQHCDLVVALGECMAATLREEGVDPNRIAIIRTWDSDDLPSQTIPAPQARELAKLPERFTVMYSGYAGAWHDFDPVLACVQALAYEPHLQFLFVGEGPGIERVRNWYSRHPGAHVIFRPYVPAHQRNASLCCGDLHLVCLKPSMLGTCVPSKLNALLALGRPVLVVAPPQCQTSLDAESSGAGACTPTGAELSLAVQNLYKVNAPTDSMQARAISAFREKHSRTQNLSKWVTIIKSISPNKPLDS